jgi:hypothetical protein
MSKPVRDPMAFIPRLARFANFTAFCRKYRANGDRGDLAAPPAAFAAALAAALAARDARFLAACLESAFPLAFAAAVAPLAIAVPPTRAAAAVVVTTADPIRARTAPNALRIGAGIILHLL